MASSRRAPVEPGPVTTSFETRPLSKRSSAVNASTTRVHVGAEHLGLHVQLVTMLDSHVLAHELAPEFGEA